jgi:hypothetical protein
MKKLIGITLILVGCGVEQYPCSVARSTLGNSTNVVYQACYSTPASTPVPTNTPTQSPGHNKPGHGWH